MRSEFLGSVATKARQLQNSRVSKESQASFTVACRQKKGHPMPGTNFSILRAQSDRCVRELDFSSPLKVKEPLTSEYPPLR